jgi:adenylyltransferase/sulfurtransferase
VTDAFARYHRQMLLPGFGPAAQQRIADAHIAIVGVGALGCSLADQLARAGVGTITLIDRDFVELTNLQRQTLFTEADARAGTPKAEAAAARLIAISSAIRTRPFAADLTARNAEELLDLQARKPAVILDGTDNFETRYLLNDISVKYAIPNAYAGVVGTRGMQATFLPDAHRTSPCLRCIFPDIPAPGSVPTCDTAGVLGPTIAIATGAQAADALKIITANTHLLSGTLLEFDVWNNIRRRIDLRALGATPDCPCCATREFTFLEATASDTTATLCGQRAVQIPGRGLISFDTLATALTPLGRIERSRFMLRFFPTGRDAVWLSIFADGRTIVQGVDRIEEAKSLHARYVGA